MIKHEKSAKTHNNFTLNILIFNVNFLPQIAAALCHHAKEAEQEKTPWGQAQHSGRRREIPRETAGRAEWDYEGE